MKWLVGYGEISEKHLRSFGGPTVYEPQMCRSTKYFNFRGYFNFDLGALFALPLGNFPTGDKQPYKNFGSTNNPERLSWKTHCVQFWCGWAITMTYNHGMVRRNKWDSGLYQLIAQPRVSFTSVRPNCRDLYENLAERLLNINKTTTKQASRVTWSCPRDTLLSCPYLVRFCSSHLHLHIYHKVVPLNHVDGAVVKWAWTRTAPSYKTDRYLINCWHRRKEGRTDTEWLQ